MIGCAPGIDARFGEADLAARSTHSAVIYSWIGMTLNIRSTKIAPIMISHEGLWHNDALVMVRRLSAQQIHVGRAICSASRNAILLRVTRKDENGRSVCALPAAT